MIQISVSHARFKNSHLKAASQNILKFHLNQLFLRSIDLGAHVKPWISEKP